MRAIIELSRFQSRACVYCTFNALDTFIDRERPQKREWLQNKNPWIASPQ